MSKPIAYGVVIDWVPRMAVYPIEDRPREHDVHKVTQPILLSARLQMSRTTLDALKNASVDVTSFEAADILKELAHVVLTDDRFRRAFAEEMRLALQHAQDEYQ